MKEESAIESLKQKLFQHKDLLLKVAREAIFEKKVTPSLQNVPSFLLEPMATFVTLEKNGHLRGCIGSLEAHQPLILDIAQNAYNAAYKDPRFPPVSSKEFDQLSISISVLTPPQPLPVSSEEELIQALVPFRDGVILQKGWRRGTFLPSVWESLPQPVDFVKHLKVKAGLSQEPWTPDIKVFTYRTIVLK
ncbi:MAG: AmmeMemoRadiSam system protein A [Bdellovibrio sp.]|nr:MAG: AmmeMemoRadiSam system protein A [Bdellovibrio sp.]